MSESAYFVGHGRDKVRSVRFFSIDMTANLKRYGQGYCLRAVNFAFKLHIFVKLSGAVMTTATPSYAIATRSAVSMNPKNI